ncbi:dihydrodipicolinate reductase C-terminal domain-containing protein [uncultured Agrococcus sp.]|uniref:4-hydroxy-tetrahydrodipicolinate reductase n=1 Tax=uncultured Agrococcus sp. TaxID=382258 RepID=UPI0025E7D55E|nr:dihydrodipicolinate reductase C-terminal domain-containing protein [uncultured Agrococcus sp.]
MTTTVGVVGATGRLGSVAVETINAMDGFTAKPIEGRGDVDFSGCDRVFEATVFDASAAIVRAAVDAGLPTVVATSGWTAERVDELADEGANGVRIVPNFSVGSVLSTHLATVAAQHLPYAEVIEAHHEAKTDAPSGTAVRTAERIAEVREQQAFTPDEPGRGTIVEGVPVHALRLPGVSAWQEVRFGGTGETLTIRHDTLSSNSYATGIALAIGAQTPEGVVVGLDDLLGLTS